MELIGTFAHNLSDAMAAVELDRMRAADLGAIHFAWAGPPEPGEPNYWRLHGPITLIEYDNTMPAADHVHTIWRDFEGDFGRILIRERQEYGLHGRPTKQMEILKRTSPPRLCPARRRRVRKSDVSLAVSK